MFSFNPPWKVKVALMNSWKKKKIRSEIMSDFADMLADALLTSSAPESVKQDVRILLGVKRVKDRLITTFEPLCDPHSKNSTPNNTKIEALKVLEDMSAILDNFKETLSESKVTNKIKE